MTQPAMNGDPVPGEIQLLMFTVMGVTIGIDAEQIAEVLDLENAEARGLTPCGFHELLSFGDMSIEYRSPKVIMIKDRSAASAFVIDMPEDIIVVSLDAIRPMPPLIASCRTAQALWGAVVKGGEVILLADCYKLSVRCTSLDHTTEKIGNAPDGAGCS